MSDDVKLPFAQLTHSDLFQKISDICAAVNKVVDTHELLDLSLTQLMELFSAERGSIFILDEGGTGLVLKIAKGMELGEEEQLVKKMGEGVVGQVAESKRPIFVNDIASDERFLNYKARKSYKTSSFICSPLMVKDQLIGVVNITDKGSGSQFSPDELQLLDFVSAQIALNYRRIELYQKFKRIVKESKSLKDELGKSEEETSSLKQQIVAQEKLATIGKLAGGIAHEFNNPLDGVMRYTNLCLEHIKEDEVVRGYLLEVKNGLKRMANIVKSLLACSRNMAPTNVVIDPNVAVEQALQSWQADIAQKNIQIKKSLSENMPKLPDQGIERVISNLLRNAVDAVKQDGEIAISTSFENDQLMLSVKDSGCGLPDVDVEKIFEPFYTTKDIDKGFGLGLTIVSEVVKSYGGEIRIQSEQDQGTTFIITIPVKYEQRT